MTWSAQQLGQDIPEDLIPVAEIAKRLRTSVRTLTESWRHGGGPTTYKPLGQWLVSHAAVVEWWGRQGVEEIHARRQVSEEWVRSQGRRA